MQRNNVILASLTLAAFLGAANTVQAEDDKMMAENADVQGLHVNLANGEKIFKEGKGDVPACQSCHGPEGMGDDNLGTPRLAGQEVVFLLKQLEDFAHDRRTDQTMFVMNTNAKGLTPEDRADVAAYVNTRLKIDGKQLSSLKDLKAAGQTVGSTYLGKAIVLYGIPEKNVPACQSCHQYNGRGAEPIYPQIGRQKYVLKAELQLIAGGTLYNSKEPGVLRPNGPVLLDASYLVSILGGMYGRIDPERALRVMHRELVPLKMVESLAVAVPA